MSSKSKKKIDTAENSDRLILVCDIPIGTEEDIVRSYFGVCGALKDIELSVSESGRRLQALILFDNEESARNALMLSGALINDHKIGVYPYAEAPPHVLHPSHSRYAELLASGILTAEQIDARLGLTDTATGIITKVQGLDQRMGASSKIQEVAEYFRVKDRLGTAVNVASSVSDKALKTSVGKRVHSALEAMKEGVIEIAEDTRAVLEEKKSETSETVKAISAPEIDMEPIEQDGVEQDDEASAIYHDLD